MTSFNKRRKEVGRIVKSWFLTGPRTGYSSNRGLILTSNKIFFFSKVSLGSQWPRVLRRRSSADRLLRLCVRIPPGPWMFVCCECYVLSGRGLCDELITRPEESCRMWCVGVCDRETSSRMRRPSSALGCSAIKKNIPTGSWTHIRYLMGTRKPLRAGNTAREWMWPPSASNTKIKNEWSYTSPPHSSTCFHGLYSDIITLLYM